MTTAKPTKFELRQRLQEELRKLQDSDIAEMLPRLLRHLRMLLSAGDFKALAAYMPIGREVDARPVLEEALAAGMALLFPRYDQADSAYSLVQVKHLDRDMRKGRYGIAEPLPELPVLDALPPKTLWLIPGLGFEPVNGTRLGRGGGFYDRMLNRYPGGFRLGIAWSIQTRLQLPSEEHDMAMEAVLTEEGYCRCRRDVGMGITIGKHDNGSFADFSDISL